MTVSSDISANNRRTYSSILWLSKRYNPTHRCISIQKVRTKLLLPPALDLEVGLTYAMLQFLRLGPHPCASEETELTRGKPLRRLRGSRCLMTHTVSYSPLARHSESSFL